MKISLICRILCVSCLFCLAVSCQKEPDNLVYRPPSEPTYDDNRSAWGNGSSGGDIGQSRCESGTCWSPGGRTLSEAERIELINGVLSQQTINDVLDDIRRALQQGTANGINKSADYAANLYQRGFAIAGSNPRLIEAFNTGLIPLKNGIQQLSEVNNTQTMSWFGLTNAWLWELGPNPANFSDNMSTTNDLRTQEGVNQARAVATQRAQQGQFGPVDPPYLWTYGQTQFYNNLSNIVTSFLGSYTTFMSVQNNGNGTATINFLVKNKSGWASATRLRKDLNGDGQHDEIIPDKDRNQGIRLGGNMDQEWRWSETISL